MENKIYVNDKLTRAEELHEIVKQKPNKKFIFKSWRPYLSLYNMGNPEKEKGIKAWFTKIGEPPVVLDTLQTYKSAKQLGLYAFNNGYFHTVTSVKTRINRKNNKVEVHYYIYTGQPYYFGTMDYLIASDGIETLVKQNNEKRKLEAGNIYSATAMDEERNRLVELFRNNGYYGFQKNYIRYEADTSQGQRTVNLKMIITDQPIYYKDSTVFVPHQKYAISNIYVDPDFDYTKTQSYSKDTTTYEGYQILHRANNRYLPDLFTSSIHFEKDEMYKQKKVEESYSHLVSLKVFKSSEIEFKRSKEDPYKLDAFIKLKPFQKRSITLELEGTNTSGNYGIFGSISVLNRSLFKRGEIFDITFRGGFEAQANLNVQNEIFNTYEFGVEFGLNFPRFVIPSNWQKKLPKRMMPKTRISTGAGRQFRQEFDRIFVNLGLGYSWKESEKKTHQIQLVDINYLLLQDIDEDYLKSLDFIGGYQDALIWATRYVYTYNSQQFGASINRSYFSSSIEFSGNFLSLFNNVLEDHVVDGEPTGQKALFGVPYAQYVKIDLDYRNYTKLRGEQQLAWRLYSGLNYTYGNTEGSPPFEKSYFGGGSNDIRGWLAYKLGPGNFENVNHQQEDTVFSTTAPIKLMFNIEYRFPILRKLRGALFADFGNIWYYNRTSSVEEDLNVNLDHYKFILENIPSQIAVSPGFGFRYDFGFFVFRLDGAYRLYDPGEPEGQRLSWLPKDSFDGITWNFAIGYPF